MFDTPPKQHFDRFWSTVATTTTTAAGVSVVASPSSALAVVSSSSSSSGLLTPPLSPQSSSSAAATNSTTSSTTTSTYQFLDQTSQRIECDENGKSYLQLGTVSHHHHHHLPVTPVIQPKPLVNLSGSHGHHHRRSNGGGPPLLPSCRPLLPPPRPANHTPACDHHHQSGLFHSSFQRRLHQGLVQQRSRCSPCYRQQRSDMLSLSLHKLHAARQRSDSSLRRSVLICNMLRYIEDESTTEQREEQEAVAAAAQQLSFHHHHSSLHHHHHHDQQQQAVEQQQQQQQSYWANQMAGFVAAAPPTPNPYRDGSAGAAAECSVGSNSFGGSVSDIGNVVSGFDAPLKDFNSAFRQTPLPSPTHDMSEEEERGSGGGGSGGGGINWSSVLSLSSQAELEPLNNNTYTDSGHHHSLWTTAAGGADMSDVDLSQHSFDDISWKLSPISADEVLKAFPDENLFQCAA